MREDSKKAPSFRTPGGKLVTRSVATKSGKDSEGAWVEASSQGVRARWYGGHYIELFFKGKKHPFHVINTGKELVDGPELSPEYVADRLWEFIRDDYEDLQIYRKNRDDFE